MNAPIVPRIRVKALGLHWRGDAILAAEIRELDGTLKGVRPLGGTVEPGEETAKTVVREFQEELGQSVTITGPAIVLENIFTFRGQPGHEIVFVYPIRFDEGAFAYNDVIHFQEDSGEDCTARWFPLSDLDAPGGVALFPNGLRRHLVAPPPN